MTNEDWRLTAKRYRKERRVEKLKQAWQKCWEFIMVWGIILLIIWGLTK